MAANDAATSFRPSNTFPPDGLEKKKPVKLCKFEKTLH